MTLQKLGEAFGKSTANVARYCLPADDPRHVHPPASVGAAMKAWSGGLLHLGNFSDPWSAEIEAEWIAAGAFLPAEEAAR